jgi:hypothetical protein
VGPIRPVRRQDPVNAPVEPVRPTILTPLEREEARKRREQARKKVVEEERKKKPQGSSGGVDHFG